MRIQYIIRTELIDRDIERACKYLLEPESGKVNLFSLDVLADTTVVSILLEAGYDPSVASNSVIKLASEAGYLETVDMLNNAAAVRQGQTEVVELLLQERSIPL